MKLGAWLRLWIGAFAFVLIMTLAFASPANLVALVNSEIGKASETLGRADTERVLNRTNTYWRLIFTDALDAQQEKIARGNENSAKVASNLNRGIQGVLDRIKALSYLAMFRLQWLGESIVPAMFFIIAAAVDGLVSRRKRAFNFRSTSTVSFNTSSYLVLMASMMPLFFLIAPVAISPVVLLFSGLAVAGAVWLFFCHLPGAAPLIGMHT